MDANRRRFLRGIGAAGVVGFAGCTGGPTGSTTTEPDDGDGGDGGMETTEPTEEGTEIGMVYATGGLGDGSFNDQAQQGLFDAEDEFGVDYQEVQPDEVSEFASFQQQFAQSSDPDYDLVCCIGFLQTDALVETSESYPDQNFMLVDSVVESPNVANYVFAEHEGSFLVGQLAGLLTTMDFSAGGGETNSGESRVGFVGGVESDLIGKFEAGFAAGVAYADDGVEVLTNYVGDFNDPTGGREAATAMYENGADIVYHASGNTGTGVFQAAQEQGRYAIGVDRDQSVTREDESDVILASMVKRVDTAVYASIESVVNDDFQGGSIVELGLEEEGVANVYGQDLGSEIPSDVKDQIATARQEIIDGDISVPTDPDEV
jgi:basic membrane protein A